MNNDLSIRPAYLSGQTPAEAFAESLGFAQPPRISMNNDRFNVVDENGDAVVAPSLALNVIMLWENDTRIYYPKDERGNSTYDPESPTRPTCYSDNRITPSKDAAQPQAQLCANCVHSVWDQPTPRGNLVPACANRYKVAVLVAGAGGRVFLLNVPPASRKAYEQYRRHLKTNHAGPSEVITKLGYVDKAFTFEFAGWVMEQTAEFVGKLMQTDEAAIVVNAFDRPVTNALPAPKAAEPVQQVEKEPAPVFDRPAPVQAIASAAPPPPAEPSRRGRGRPPKGQEAAGAPTPASPAAQFTPPASPSVPSYADTGDGAFQGAAVGSKVRPMMQGVPTKGNGGFGMEAAQAAPANLQAALDAAFGPR